MPDYLPLTAFRQGLLPATCRSCAWWQTTGGEHLSPEASADRRRQWMTAVEDAWGAWGLLLIADDAEDGRAREPLVVGSVSFAPAGSVPRLRVLPFASLTEGSALLFCFWLDEDQPRSQGKRLLHKALGQLKSRGMVEAFALAGSLEAASLEAESSETGSFEAVSTPEIVTAGQCGLFSADFLTNNGFDPVMESGDLVLMRADLRGLLFVLSQVETAVRRVLNHEPTPSPAAWTHRGTS